MPRCPVAGVQGVNVIYISHSLSYLLRKLVIGCGPGRSSGLSPFQPSCLPESRDARRSPALQWLQPPGLRGQHTQAEKYSSESARESHPFPLPGRVPAAGFSAAPDPQITEIVRIALSPAVRISEIRCKISYYQFNARCFNTY